MNTIRLLVVNGCEHTVARGADPGWAELAAERFRVPLVNLAAPRSSNHRIVRTTVSELPTVVQRAGVLPGEVLVVPMFAPLDRTEIGVDRSRSWRRRRDSGRAVAWRQLGPWDVAAGDAQALAWYSHMRNDASDLVELLLGLTMLGRWLDRFGSRHAFALAESPGSGFGPAPNISAYSDRIDHRWLIGGDLERWPATALTTFNGGGDHQAWFDGCLVPHLVGASIVSADTQ